MAVECVVVERSDGDKYVLSLVLCGVGGRDGDVLVA